ncbi:MAG: hypothetical protein OXH28_12475 [bacterium]|nr:hypothetical protein [bacterium]
MSHLRHLVRPLVVIALLATVLSIAAAAPSGAQTIRVYTFESAETESDDNSWEIQFTAQTLGNCTPNNAPTSYVTPWLPPGGTDLEVLDPGTCTYRITAVARQAASPRLLCKTLLGWDSPSGTNPIRTSRLANAPTTVQAQHYVNMSNEPVCSAQPTLSVKISPDAVVEELPESATDDGLTDRAERAAAITDFQVRVTPRASSAAGTGCDRTLEFTVAGDGEPVEAVLGAIGSATCRFRITVTEAPPPFAIVKTSGKSFDTSVRNETANTGYLDEDTGLIALDLSEHVRLPVNRIAIIQDVVNNPTNEGSAAYRVTSECGGVSALPPVAITNVRSGIYTLPGGQTVAGLANGRFTVHKPGFAYFGPGASYPAVAASLVSDEIGGCTVTASIDLVADHCTLAGADTRTLSWTSDNPLQHFDFEFDIYCGGAQPPRPEAPPQPAAAPDSSTDDPATDDSSTTADVEGPGVRIVARLLGNGKIEFGLQQQDSGSWSDPILPGARLFPATTSTARWLVSTPITAGDATVRIVARRLQDGRVEFGLQQRDGGSWSNRMLPQQRFFPTTAAAGRWLDSSTLNLEP